MAVSNLDKKIYIYTSENNNSGWKEATNLDSYSITYHLNGGSADVKDGQTKTSYLKQGESKILYSASIADPSKKYYVFADWYTDAALTKPLRAGIEVKNGTHLDLYAKYSYENYKLEYQIENQSGIEATITNPNASFTSFTQKDLTDQGGSFLLQEATSDKPEQIMFDGWYTSPDYSVASKLSGNEINQCQSYMLYARFVKVVPKVTIDDEIFSGFVNVFNVNESDGKLSNEAMTIINKRINEIRANVDEEKYVKNFMLGDTAIELDKLKDYVFDQNATLTLTKENKFVVSYTVDKNVIKKYYTRDSSGNVESTPSLDLSIYENDDRKLYKWKNGTNSYGNNDIKDILNKNPQKNDYAFEAWWSYRVDIEVVEYPNADGLKINGVLYTVGSYSIYAYEGEKLTLAVKKTNAVGSKTHTQVNVDGQEKLNNYVAELWPSGDVTEIYTMPGKTIKIVVNRADKI